MEKKIRVRASIVGRVQGVFFRMETQKAATRYGVSGWVKNKIDGTVEALFEGDRDKVNAVLDWCKQGPPLSAVEKLTITDEEYRGEFTNFEVRY